jgi:hypothetical protein
MDILQQQKSFVKLVTFDREGAACDMDSSFRKDVLICFLGYGRSTILPVEVRDSSKRCASFHLMDPSSRVFYVHWEREARRCIASLRARYDCYPDDRWLAELIAELQEASPEFRAWWPEHNIVLDCGSICEINHPLVGRLVLHPTVFPMPEQPDLQMIVYTPLALEGTGDKLRVLMAGRESGAIS